MLLRRDYGCCFDVISAEEFQLRMLLRHDYGYCFDAITDVAYCACYVQVAVGAGGKRPGAGPRVGFAAGACRGHAAITDVASTDCFGAIEDVDSA